MAAQVQVTMRDARNAARRQLEQQARLKTRKPHGRRLSRERKNG